MVIPESKARVENVNDNSDLSAAKEDNPEPRKQEAPLWNDGIDL